MILGLDVGNSNIVVGIWADHGEMYRGRLSTIKNGTTTEYAIRLKCMMDLHKVDVNDIEGAIISSVVPEMTYALEKAVKLLISKPPLVVKDDMKTGLEIAIDNPKSLGADRIVASVAAMNEYKLPLVILDMGTATTVDIIDKNHRHLGGCIMPGIKTSLNALAANASQLSHIEIDAPVKLIGKNTIDSMRSGLLYGNACMVDGLIARFEEELGEKLTVVATGGLAKTVIKHCKHDIIYDELLIIKGLATLYNMNKQK